TELWSGLIESEKDANEVAQFIRPFVTVARSTGVALVFLHHTTKSGEQYRGSGQLAAGVDVVLTLRQPNLRPLGERSHRPDDSVDDDGFIADDGRRRLEGRGRAGVRVDVRLHFDGRAYIAGDGTLPLRARILRALQIEPMSGNELRERLGIRKERVLDELNALTELGAIGLDNKKHVLTYRGLDMLEPASAPHAGPVPD
ncbi:MAG TPA: hypothetical protein VGT98_10975, partial [Candidatus Elarobacter sp.]|nr:hypothetical protein [Candidatus Elarobacter sp.]